MTNEPRLSSLAAAAMVSLTAMVSQTAMVSLAAFAPARAAEPAAPVALTLKDHRFTPDAVTVTAGERFRIEVQNQDPTPAEFESSDLRVEKIVVPGGKISVMAGPLKPGTYKFFDDYHPEATGTVTAVERKAQE